MPLFRRASSDFAMAAAEAILIGLLMTLCGATAEINSFWPLEQDITYQYVADVRAGATEPAPFGSQYSLLGTLRVQSHGEEAVVQLSDVQYQLYNGPLAPDQHPNTTKLPLPEDAGDLTTPFRIQYKSGKAKKLFAEATDAVWALNMKRGLASLLQLDLSPRMSMEEHSSFWGVEDTIFGTCDVAYSVYPEDGLNIMTKAVNPVSCKGYPIHQWQNIESEKCGAKHEEEPVSSLYKRVYRVRPYNRKTGSEPLIMEISSQSATVLMPFRGKSDVHYFSVNQTLKLVSVHPVQDRLTLVQEREVQDLKYALPEPDSLSRSAVDVTQGRIKYDREALGAQALELLGEMLDYQEESHVKLEAPDMLRGSLAGRLVHGVLRRMGSEDLGDMYSQLSEGKADRELAKRELLLSLLPQVGTAAAAVTARNLVRKHKVKTDVALTLLQTVPFNVRHPSEKLLLELEDLIHLDKEYPEEVKHAALLSFATLVYRTCKGNTNAEFLNRTVDKYAEIYFKRLAAAKDDYATQMVYLQGLDNMQVGKAAEYLEALAVEGVGISRHLQHLALFATSKTALSNYNRAYRIYWPILEDRKQHLQLRVAALHVMLYSASSMDEFMNIHWLMSKERNNVHLYKLYYSTLQALSTSTNPCYGHGSLPASKILRFTPPPAVSTWASGFQLLDYADKTYGFGSGLLLQMVGDQDTGYPSILYARSFSHAMGSNTNPSGIYLKVEGLTEIFWSAVVEDEEEPTKAAPKVDVLGILRKPPSDRAEKFARKLSQAQLSSRPIHVELLLILQGRTVSTLYLNQTLLDKFLSTGYSRKMKELENFSSLDVEFPMSAELHLPTDLGVPLIFNAESPVVLSASGTAKIREGIELETNLRLWSHRSYHLSIFNPAAVTWHGVARLNSLDAQVPVRVGLRVDAKGSRLVFGRPHGTDQLNGTLGARWYAQTRTFVYEESSNSVNSRLEASCATCQRVADVSKGRQHLNELVLFNAKVPGMGVISDVRIFDCERPLSFPAVKKMAAGFLDRATMSNQHDITARLYLGLSHLLGYEALSPPVGQCGFLVRLIPDPELGKQTHVEVQLKVSKEPTPGGNIVLEGYKLHVRGQVALKDNQDETLQRVEFTSEGTTTAGNTKTSIITQMTAYRGNQPSGRVCWNFHKNFPERGEDVLQFGWGNEEVETEVSVSAGSLVEGNETACPTDGPSISIKSRGEISDEQKERARSDEWPYGQCKLDRQKSEWQGPLTPRSYACYKGAVLLTTVRKITYSVTYNKLPTPLEDALGWLEEAVRTALGPHFSRVSGVPLPAQGSAQLELLYSARRPILDVSVRTPWRHYVYSELPASDPDEYNPSLDNTHLSRFFQLLLVYGIDSPCIINPETVYTADNATVSHRLGGEYELAAGDKGYPNNLAVYVKSQGGDRPLVVKFVAAGATLEISRDGATLNAKNIPSLENGFQYPEDEYLYSFRAWQSAGQTMVYSRRNGVFLIYTGQTLDIEQPITLKGRTSGLCGNLNGDPGDDSV